MSAVTLFAKPVTVISESNGSGTSDWVDFDPSSYVPGGTSLLWVHFYVMCDGNGTAGAIQVRANSLATLQEVVSVPTIGDTADTDANSNDTFVGVDPQTSRFQYNIPVTGDADYVIQILGYFGDAITGSSGTSSSSSGGGSSSSVTWSSITGKPSTFPPTVSDVQDIIGSSLIAGSNIVITDNGDGTYTLSLGGSAGGDLSGTYPNPTVAKVDGNSVTLTAAKGSVIAGTGASAMAGLAVGADGTVLTADSGQTTGLKWGAASSSIAIGGSISGGPNAKSVLFVSAAGSTLDQDTDLTYDKTSNLLNIGGASTTGILQFGNTTGLKVDTAAGSSVLRFVNTSATSQLEYWGNTQIWYQASGTVAGTFNTSAGRVNYVAGTAPVADPSSGVTFWADVTNGWCYRTSTSGEGAGQTNRVHNRGNSQTGVGTDYSLTSSLATPTFGTTNPTITLPTAGTYLVMLVAAFVAGASANDQYEVQFYNQSDSAVIGETFINTNLGASAEIDLQYFAFVTVSASKTLAMRVRNATAARGTLKSTGTKVGFVRLF